MLEKLVTASQLSKSGFSVYTNKTMPSRLHFTNPVGSQRIAPIFVMPDLGWVVTSRESFESHKATEYHPMVSCFRVSSSTAVILTKVSIQGAHGYDNEESEMHAIFVAHGPFANYLKSNADKRRALSSGTVMDDQTTVIPGFSNLEIYNLVARLLGIEQSMWAPNNGTQGFWDTYLS